MTRSVNCLDFGVSSESKTTPIFYYEIGFCRTMALHHKGKMFCIADLSFCFVTSKEDCKTCCPVGNMGEE